MNRDLRLQPIAIGSLPDNNTDEAMELVKKDFFEIPFCPQLANVSKNEDMMLQYLEGLPSFSHEKNTSLKIDTESDEFFIGLEEFFNDYEEIIADINSSLLEKYAITQKCSSAFSKFEEIIHTSKPDYAKGQIIGPFTLAGALQDFNDRYFIFDETLTDVVVKLLTLKALWQIRRIKTANPSVTPIIFMDEPSVSQIGTSTYISTSEDVVIQMLKTISDIISKNGALSAIHCCGKCDWRIPISTGVDIINFDAYTYSDNFNIYHKELKKYLENGGKIAWGLVPTLSGKLLEELKVEDLAQIFFKSVKYLTNKGLDEKLIIDNSLVTPSCGAGALSVENSRKAMDMLKELSDYLRRKV